MIIVEVGHDTVAVSRTPRGLEVGPVTLVLFSNHAAARACAGEPLGIPESVQAAALHVAGVLAAGEAGLGSEAEHAA